MAAPPPEGRSCPEILWWPLSLVNAAVALMIYLVVLKYGNCIARDGL
jgi:hypothetical protein